MDGQSSSNTTAEFKEYLAMVERKFDKEWESFYEGLNTRSRPAMMYNYFFIIRKSLFAFTLFYMYEMVAI
jgi:hypothetical protein